MPSVPVNSLTLVLYVAVALLPGGILGPGRAGSGRWVRLLAAVLVGGSTGALLGPATLESGYPLPQAVLGLCGATVLLAEGVAGRGGPWAGWIAVFVYLATVARDFQDRTGETIPAAGWIIVAVVAGLLALTGQRLWRGIWRTGRGEPLPPEGTTANPQGGEEHAAA